MAYEFKVTKIGNSLGVILPKELLVKLKIGVDDKLFATETSRGIEVSPYDPIFSQKMDTIQTLIQENRDVLKKLAE